VSSSEGRPSADRPSASPPPIRPPRVVAELGRPETPEETAARKAETSRRHRSNQTLRNLVLALLASLAIVLFLVLVVVRPDGATRQPVDYRSIAAQTQPTVSAPLAAPVLPKGWTANDATIQTGSDGITFWSIGFITPDAQYIGLVQGIAANASWTADQLQRAQSTGKSSIAGTEWVIYDRRSVDNPGNFAYSLATTVGDSTVALHGTATTKEFSVLAAAVTAQLDDATK
jgi:hypothetical protein